MSDHIFWIIICSIICLTIVMLATIISVDAKNNEDNEVHPKVYGYLQGAENREISDEELKRAANIFATAVCKKIFEEDKHGRIEERNTEG